MVEDVVIPDDVDDCRVLEGVDNDDDECRTVEDFDDDDDDCRTVGLLPPPR